MHGKLKRFHGHGLFVSFLILLSILSFVQPVSAQSDVLRFMSWNILNYTLDGVADHSESNREPYYRTVIENADPDILVVLEMWSGNGSTRFMNNVLNVVAPGKWAVSNTQLIPTSSYDCQLYYRTDRNLSMGPIYIISAPIRSPIRFEIRYDNGGPASDTVFVYAVHLKASNTTADQDVRAQQVSAVIDHMTRAIQPLTNRPVLFCGDFNLYTSSEPAWQNATADGIFRDPINRVGSWTNNSGFADVHTQSPRISSTGYYDGGSTGGMDDRFDFILATPALFDSTRMDYQPGSYMAYGNDGNHYNQSINYGQNAAVNDRVADALYYASDHLPVIMDIVVGGFSSVDDRDLAGIPSQFRIVSVYPNPFNSTTNVAFALQRAGQVNLALFDILGRQVWANEAGYLDAGIHRVAIHAKDLSSGVYLLRSTGAGMVDERKITLIR